MSLTPLAAMVRKDLQLFFSDKRSVIVSRVSTNARFRIECAGGVPDGLSPYLCAKSYFGEWGVGARNAGEPEARQGLSWLEPSSDIRLFRNG